MNCGYAYYQLYISGNPRVTINWTSPMPRFAYASAAMFFVFGWTVYLVVLFPGFMSVDTVHQLLEARTGQIGDWHSPFMTWLFGVLDQIYPGPAGMLVVQISLMWAGLALFWYSALAPLAPRVGAALLCLMMFYPPIFGLSGAIWKDVLMAGALMVFCGALAGVYTGRLTRVVMVALAFAAALFALLARVNAIFCLTPLLTLLVSSMIRPRGWSGRAGAAVAGAVISLVLTIGSMSLNAKIASRSLQPILSIALFDVTGTIANVPKGERQNRLYFALPAPLIKGRTVQNLVQSYSSRDWQTVFYGDRPGLNPLGFFQPTHVAGFGSLSTQERHAVLISWRQAITREPNGYLTHRLAAFEHVLAFRNTLWQPVMFDPANYPRVMQKIVPPFSTQTPMQAGLSAIFGKMAYYFPYKPWFCLLVALILLAGLLINSAKYELEIALLLAVPAHLFGLFLLAPTPDFRYSHIIFLFTGLAVTRVICTFLADHSTQLVPISRIRTNSLS